MIGTALEAIGVELKMEKEKFEPDWIKERIREYWNRPETRNPNTSRFATDDEERAWKSFFSEELGEEKQRILDVGTGIGFLALPLAERGHDVVGIDLSDEMILKARERAKERGLDLDLRIGDAESLDLEDESFDAVVSRWVLWTLPNPENAIREWKRVVRTGGKVYAFTSDFSGKNGGRSRGIKRNLGMLMISITERRSAWTQHYDKHVEEKLPLCYNKPASRVDNKVKLFEKCGLGEVTATKMKDVSEIFRKKHEEMPLRYKIAWDSSVHEFYCVSGSKPEEGVTNEKK